MNSDNDAKVQNINNLSAVYLGLGTNLGNKKENIELALDKIEKQIGNLVSLSAFYVSKPDGFESENLFLNCAVHIISSLTPHELILTTQAIEKEMGRTIKTNTQGYSDRIIDIDILLYNSIVINNPPTLIVPHPRMHKREFVLKPLMEIAPDLIHPVLNKTIAQLVDELKLTH